VLLVGVRGPRYPFDPIMIFDITLFTRGVDYARFSRVFYSEPFQVALVDAINLKERTVRERQQLPNGAHRFVVYIAPRVELPALFSRLANGYAIGYEETTVFDSAGRRASSSVRTPGGDLLHVAAETLFSESPEGVQADIKLEVHAKILGIGSAIEKFVANETRKRYAVVERALQQYVDANRDLDLSAPAVR
jgi:hypothetical protein